MTRSKRQLGLHGAAAALFAVLSLFASRPAPLHAQTQPDAPKPAGEIVNLDNDAARWDTPHCEIAAQRVECGESGIGYSGPAPAALNTPSGDGSALRGDLISGPSYPAVMHRRKLTDYPQAAFARAYELDFRFLYRPASTFNNGGAPSRVQAIEFALSTWRSEPSDSMFRVYDWELQFLNVREGPALSPIWRLWTGAKGAWEPVGATEVPARLAANEWHHVTLRVEAASGVSAMTGGWAARYVSFTIDGVTYPIRRDVQPMIREYQPEMVANVLLQLDGPANINTVGGYEVLLDAVTVRWYDRAPWSQNCPLLPADAALLFGGAAEQWARLADTPNGWKYNGAGLPPEQAPPIRSGYIPRGMTADWWDGAAAHMGVAGEARMDLAYAATVWCPEEQAGAARLYLPLARR